MASVRQIFHLSGPLHLTTVDWSNIDHRKSVAASLVRGVYILERDRHENRQGSHSLAPPWWNFFHFYLHYPLIDPVDSSIFGAIYEFQPQQSPNEAPHYVIAFRGTSKNCNSLCRDLKLNYHLFQNRLHCTSRFEIAIESVRNTVAAARNSSVWLAGHSLGSALALLAGRHMAKTGVFLEAFLFNPPFVSVPTEIIKDENLKLGIRTVSSLLTAGVAAVLKGNLQENRPEEESFFALRDWVPRLFVNPRDIICAEYIGYFKHREKMEKMGMGKIERLATQHSKRGLVKSVIQKELHEPFHLIPSANLTVNKSPYHKLKKDHGIDQWWSSDLNLQSKVYMYM